MDPISTRAKDLKTKPSTVTLDSITDTALFLQQHIFGGERNSTLGVFCPWEERTLAIFTEEQLLGWWGFMVVCVLSS